MKKELGSKAEWGPCYSPRAGNHLLAICDSFQSVLCVGAFDTYVCRDGEVGWRQSGLVVNFDLNIKNVKHFVPYNAAISRELLANQNWCQTTSSNWWHSVQAQFSVIDREWRKALRLAFVSLCRFLNNIQPVCHWVEFGRMIISFGISFLNSSIGTALTWTPSIN